MRTAKTMASAAATVWMPTSMLSIILTEDAAPAVVPQRKKRSPTWRSGLVAASIAASSPLAHKLGTRCL